MFASVIDGSRYFVIVPCETVNIIVPLHFLQNPINGGRRYFSLQVEHLNFCVANFLRFPFMSFIRCFSSTSVAMSAWFTEFSFSAILICPSIFSIMDSSIL